MKRLGILLYEEVQPMDVIGPWEIWATWKNLLGAQIGMFLVAEQSGLIECDNQIVLKTHCDFSQAPQFDYLLIPGGRGRLAQVKNQHLLTFIREQARQCEYLLSVCSGAFLLHEAGLLHGLDATTYWRALPELAASGDVNIVEERIVKNEKIWLSGGVSSGLDLALELIATVAGKETAGKIQLLFEYFPRRQLFCSLATMHDLPAYYNPTYSAELPRYIKEEIISN